jgi:hypothetical protein
MFANSPHRRMIRLHAHYFIFAGHGSIVLEKNCFIFALKPYINKVK